MENPLVFFSIPEKVENRGAGRRFDDRIAEAAYNTAEAIARSLETEGAATTLRNERCLEIFVTEWLRARWAYIRALTDEMTNRPFRESMLRTIEEATKELGDPAPEVPDSFTWYSSFAHDWRVEQKRGAGAELPWILSHYVPECYRITLANSFGTRPHFVASSEILVIESCRAAAFEGWPATQVKTDFPGTEPPEDQ